MTRFRVNVKTFVAHRLKGLCERAERMIPGNRKDVSGLAAPMRRCRLCANEGPP